MYISILRSASQKAFHGKLLIFTENSWDKWKKEGKSELITT